MVENEGRQLVFSAEEWSHPLMAPDDFRTALQRVDMVEVIPLDGVGYSHALQMDENMKWRWAVFISSNLGPKEQLLTFIHEIVHVYWDYWMTEREKEVLTPKQKAEHDQEEKLIEKEATRFFKDNHDLAAEIFTGFSPKKD